MTSYYRACARLHRVAVLGLLALFWLPASHAAPFSSTGATGAPGATVSLVVYAEGLSLWNAANFDVGYDPAILDFLPEEEFGAEPGFLGDAFPMIDEVGFLLLSVFSPVGDVVGNGALIRMSFEILPDAPLGPTTLNFVWGGFDYPFEDFSTTIMVAQDTSQPVPAPGTTLLLLAGLGGLLAARRRGLTGAKERIVH